MPFTIEGPSEDEINRVLAELQEEAKAAAGQFMGRLAAGTAALIKIAYREKVYQKPEGVFGYPKSQNQSLGQAVQFEVDFENLEAAVFTNRPEAPFVEFGTGIFNLVGRPKKPIRPKRGKVLAFAVWKLPTGFRGIFIPRNEADGPVPFGAIGVVLVKKVAGMQPRPVWNDEDVEKAIDRLIDLEAEKTGVFKPR
jgi:hypothetical protein